MTSQRLQDAAMSPANIGTRHAAQLPTNAPLQPRAQDALIPLSGSQRRLWSYAFANGHRSVDAVASATSVLGSLDVGKLRAAVGGVVERHETLRTRVVGFDIEARHAIDAAQGFELEHFNLAGLVPARAVTEARQIADEYAEQPVDPAKGPLFRAALLTLGESDHVLVTVADHLISDAASAGIITDEVWAAYRNSENAELLPAPRVQFADYVVWQSRTYDSWLTQHGAYWRDRLRGASATRLPRDFATDAVPARTAALFTIPFGKKLTAVLRALAVAREIRLPIAVLALHACAMSRWCDQRDLCVSFASHGRHIHPELKGMVGLLASFPHLRIEIAARDDFITLLERVRHEVELAFAHFDFDRALELNPGCGESDIGFNWTAPEALRNPAGTVRPAQDTLVLRPFPLRLSWLGKLFVFYSNTPAGIVASVTYRSDLFARARVERFGNDLRALARRVAEDPRMPLAAELQAGSCS